MREKELDIKDSIHRITIFGGGRTGRATADFLSERKKEVFLTDSNRLNEFTKQFLREKGIPFEEGEHSQKALSSQLIVLSPGVPPDLPIINKCRDQGIPVIGEIELSYRFCTTETIIGITGTNGKTTTTKMLEKILEYNGFPAISCGNIGKPFVSQVGELSGKEIIVLEISSYQLQTIKTFRPKVAVLLNISPDHLKRHETFENYRNTKLKIFENQGEEDFAIANEELEVNIGTEMPEILTFHKREASSFDLAEHNRENLAAALKAASVVLPPRSSDEIEVPRKLLAEAIEIPHRLRLTEEIKGRLFYDDSKATNPASTAAALRWTDKPTWLLLGGEKKKRGYHRLAEKIPDSPVKGIIFFGKDRKRLKKLILPLPEIKEANICSFPHLEKSVKFALEKSEVGDAILLSPACASFDDYENFEERGEHFKRIVRGIKHRQNHT